MILIEIFTLIRGTREIDQPDSYAARKIKLYSGASGASRICAALWTRRTCRGRGDEPLPIRGSIPYGDLRIPGLYWCGGRIVVGKSEPRGSSYMDTRDMSSDVARVGIPKRGALFRSASASSVSRVMLGDTTRRRRRGQREQQEEEEEDAAHVAVIVLMGQIASVTNELSARGRLPWDGRWCL